MAFATNFKAPKGTALMERRERRKAVDAFEDAEKRKVRIWSRTKPRPLCPICGTKPLARGCKTCGVACGYRLKMQNLRSQKPCQICGKLFWPRRYSNGLWMKCCSQVCEFKRRTIGHEHILTNCAECGAKVKRFKGGRKAVKYFCSVPCRRKHMRGPNSPLYRGGRDPNRGRGWMSIARETRERDCHTCLRCNEVHVPGTTSFPVDHIIPWRCFENKWDANDPSNLATLCPRCHQYKTLIVERRYFKGNVQPMEDYKRALRLPSAQRTVA